MHNLKNLNVSIPRNKLVVVTGLSGSGKSTLIFDVLYSEGQRRYLESLPTYVRQFLKKFKKPNVDSITGISPSIAISNKNSSKNPKSTVGTVTEIYDYFRLLFHRLGEIYSPISNDKVKKHNTKSVVEYIKNIKKGTKLLIMVKIEGSPKEKKDKILIFKQKEFVRVKLGDDLIMIDDLESNHYNTKDDFYLIVDRLVVNKTPLFYSFLYETISKSFIEGKGRIYIENMDEGKIYLFSNKLEADGVNFLEPNEYLFNFNNSYGACPNCNGYGFCMDVDESLVIPNKNLSIYEDTVSVWRGDKMNKWKKWFIDLSDKYDFPIHKPYDQLSKLNIDFLWNGNDDFPGINGLFDFIKKKSYKIQYRVMLSRYRGKTICKHCNGSRLKKEASYIKVSGKSIIDLTLMPIKELKVFFDSIKLSESNKKVCKTILEEINKRISCMVDLGLDYLTINRSCSSLSSGEFQRALLTKYIGNNLSDSLYLLDEPSVGLHPKDTSNLIKVLKKLRALTNTVIVIEHEGEVIKMADYIIDIGPYAGRDGGEVVFSGLLSDFKKTNTLTSKYLRGDIKGYIINKKDKKYLFDKEFIKVLGAKDNNLKNIDVKFPINSMTVVTGVSGAGKSTLVNNIIYRVLYRAKYGFGSSPGLHTDILFDDKCIDAIEFINDSSIGRSSRSNCLTYTKIYDQVRELFSSNKVSKIRGYNSSHFSFNSQGGRCDKCKGMGKIIVDMQFMVDLEVDCDECNGNRFNKDILDIKVYGKNILDVLNMTVDEAMDFFSNHPKINKVIKILKDLGLSYICLGQSLSSFSSGELQRIKLTSFLINDTNDKIIFIFDEPSKGLHFHDVKKLLDIFNILIEKGHTLLVIEHNLEFIKSADWIIELGKYGGDNGGELVFEGTLEEIKKIDTFTSKFIKN